MNAIGELFGSSLFRIGNTQITVGTLLAAIVVAIATVLLARLVRKVAQEFYRKRSKQDTDALQVIGVVAQIAVWFVGIELIMHLLSIHLTALFAAGGFFAFGAGLAVKNTIENFLSGRIIHIEKTIESGDVIIVDGRWLIVQHIGMRCITGKTSDGVEMLIPNSLVAQSAVPNLTRGDRLHRILAQVGVAYESDLALVRKTLEEAIDHLEWRSKLRNSKVNLREFGDSSVNYDIKVWIDDATESNGRKSDLNEAVWWALKGQGITIAYPQLDMHIDRNVIDAVGRKP